MWFLSQVRDLGLSVNSADSAPPMLLRVPPPRLGMLVTSQPIRRSEAMEMSLPLESKTH